MKRKAISKKLVIKKETIARLDVQNMEFAKGGGTITCYVIESKCICEN